MTEPQLSGAAPALSRAQLLQKLLSQRGIGVAKLDCIPRRPAGEVCALSYPQQRLWFIDQLAPGNGLYNIPIALKVEGRLDLAALEWSLAQMVRRHESLRTVFTEMDGEPRQVILPDAPCAPLVRDLAALPEELRWEEALRQAREEAEHPFDLAQGPLLRAVLLGLGDGEQVVLITMHHIISDGWSIQVFVQEIAALYSAFAAGRPSPLPELPIQYADFAVWQRGLLSGEALEAELALWRRRLAGAPAVLQLPTDRERPTEWRGRGASLPVALSPELSAAVQELMRRLSLTPFMLLLTAFQIVLSRASGEPDLCVGTPIAGRSRIETENLIGFFVNTLVLRASFAGDPDVGTLLRQGRETALEAYAHQDLPFEKLVEELQPERSLERSPLFQVMFALQNLPPGTVRLPGGLTLTSLGTAESTIKFELSLMMVEAGRQLSGSFGYATDLFDETTIRRLWRGLEAVLAELAARPEHVRLSELALLSASERHQLVAEWNDSRPGASLDDPAASIHGRLDLRILSAPDAVALVFEEEQISYRELGRRSRRLAWRLRAAGAGPGRRVAVCAERSPDMVAMVLAVLRTGAAFVALDPAHPAERLSRVMADAGVSLLLTQERLRGRLTGFAGEVLCSEQAGVNAGGVMEAVQADEPRVDPLAPAYVAYTSGSTGRPKGILAHHRGVVNHLEWVVRNYGLSPADTALQLAPLPFDASLRDTLAPLLAGARVVLVPQGQAWDPEALLARIERCQVTCLPSIVPSLLRRLTDAALQTREGRELRALRLILASGERLQAADAAAVREAFGAAVRLFNQYGPSECTMISTWHPASDEEGEGRGGAGTLLVGRPIANARLHVLGAALEPLPLGAVGELAIGGPGLAYGYLGQPDRTAERFVPDPLAETPGGRLYRTGDRGRYRTDGTLEFLGRIDQQLKLRGVRVEPGEIEAALRDHPAVAEAVVLAVEFPGSAGDLRLTACLVAHDGHAAPSIAPLRSFLRERLPEALVPSGWVFLPAFPRTPNGKLDRQALRRLEPERERLSAAEESGERSPVQEMIASVWCELLRLDRVGIDEDFFALGGHSLLATQVVSRLRRAFHIELPLRDLFEAPTVARLATRVEQAMRSGRGAAVQILPVPRDLAGGLPLSFAQRRLWLIDQMEPHGAVYNMPVALRVTGELDGEVFARCCGELLRRHEVLRTAFSAGGEEPVQVIAPVAPMAMPVIDLSDIAAERRQDLASWLAAEEAARPFDLTRAPMLRATLMRMAGTEHVLLITLHHIAGDAWSMTILVRELTALYAAFAAGRPSPLPELSIQYADFAVWQRRHLQGEVLETELAYWQGRLAGAPALLELPADRPRPTMQSASGAVLALSFPGELARDLRELSRRQGVTLFMTLLTGFQALLARWSGQPDVSVGTAVAGRSHVALEELIGFFINTLVLRSRFDEDPELVQALAANRDLALEAYQHQDLPFERLVEELVTERSLSYSPLFQVMFVLQNAPREAIEVSGLRLAPVRVPYRFAKFDLSLEMVEHGEALGGSFEYNTDLFDRTTVARLAGQLERLLEAMCSTPGLRRSTAPLLGEAERHQILREWSDTRSGLPSGLCVHELFERQARRTPDAVAVVSEDGLLTYRELDRRTDQLASYLLELGVEPETPVGLCLERSAGLLIGLLAILKAGGAYLPLDPAYPRERLAFMLEDARVPVIVSEERLLPRLPETAGHTVCLDRDRERIDRQPSGRGRRAALPGHLAYAMYTSGSTGRSKGVLVEHRSLAWYALAAAANYGVRPGERVLQFASISFDISVEEIFPCLSSGATLVLGPPDIQFSPENLLAKCRSEEVTVLCMATAFWHELATVIGEAPERLPASVRLVCFGGEAVRAYRVELWLRSVERSVELVNSYGPTETTVVATLFRIAGGADFARQEVPLGRPIQDARTCVLDPGFAPVPPGISGELCLGGAGLSRGYLGRPDLTAERFIPDPFGVEPGGRLYRTGDRVRWRADGNLDFSGRLDHQVKVRGFRIEPGEVEAVLAADPGIQGAIVAVREDLPGQRRLVAYFVARPGASVALADLRSQVRQSLPEFMMPSAFVVLEQLPLTPGGKVDRRALPAPPAEAPEAELRAGDSPRTPAEELVAGAFCEVLRRERVGRQESFFELGGHSLLATRVMSRLRSAFQVELALRELFEEPTVAGLVRRVEKARQAGAEMQAPALVPAARDMALPLSFAQERLWFLDQLEPGSATYNIPVALRVVGRLNVEVLRRGLETIVHRHEALRTTFAASEGVAVQVIAEPVEMKLPLVDLPGRETDARELIAREAERPFDLSEGPLLRGLVVRLGEEEHFVLVTMHHIVSDGSSMGILMQEISALYAALSSAAPATLPPLPVQYADYAVWQRSWLQGEVLEREIGYWREHLAGAPPRLELPTDRPRPAVQSFRGAAYDWRLPSSLSRDLQALSRRQGTTSFMTLLSGFQALLGRYTGQEDIVVGTPVAGRNHLELENLIGFFVNTLVLRTDLSAEPGFGALLSRVRETVLSAHAHQEVPFEKLVEELEPERSLAHSPLFQVMFVLQNTPEAALAVEGLRLSALESPATTAKFDLTLALGESRGELLGSIEYNTDLFDATTIERLAGHFARLLAAAVEGPDRRISSLEVLSETERRQLLDEGEGTWEDSSRHLFVHQLVEARARLHPEATALVFQESHLTYGALDDRADRLADGLRALDIGPEAVVGICAARDPEMITGLLGILKAGAAYLPLDPSTPAERAQFMLRDSQARALLVSRAESSRFPDVAIPLVLLDEEMPAVAGRRESRPEPLAENLAYVIYTSGSTGRPKGVGIPHRGLINLIQWHLSTYGVTASDRGTHLAGSAFDAAVWEIWPNLAAGASLMMPDEETRLAPDLLREWLLIQSISIAFLPTPQAESLLSLDCTPLIALRALLTGGDKLHRHAPASVRFSFFNHYGPTEATVVTTACRVASLEAPAGAPWIGQPISNLHARVVDAYGELVPAGVYGELWIGGTGLSRGYVGRPDLTAERFLPDGFGAEPGARLYRTGDLVRWTQEGNLQFLGRADRQVKLRGFRLELGEIEAVLAIHPQVGEVVVLARETGAGQSRLVAYVVPAGAAVLTAGELREFLREHLPDYMVPSYFVALESLPLTPNGKIDRKALPAPESLQLDPDTYQGPRTQTESVLSAIWADVLGLDRVGVHDNFFELGGHSLLATRVMSRLRSAFQVELALRELFEEPTVAGLARRVEKARRAGNERQAPALVPAARDTALPLSFAQERLWFLDQLEPGSATYNIPVALRVVGRLNVEVLRRGLETIVHRHEALRTTFAASEGVAVQVIAEPVEMKLPLVDLPGRETDARELIAREAERPFDLSEGPLLRGLVVRLGEEEHFVLVTMHHIVSDGWSMGILIQEISALYAALSSGAPSTLPPLPVQYADYAVWQRSWLRGEVLEREIGYWREHLAGAPPRLELPTDRPRPAVQSFRGAAYDWRLPSSLSRDLQALSRRQGTTSFITLLSGFQALLGCYTGQEDIVVGTPVAGRNHLELENLIGFFVNTLVLRTDLSAEPGFGALLSRVRETVLSAHAHQEVPFEKLVEELEPERSLAHSPLFQVMFVLQNTPEEALAIQGLRLSSLEAPSMTAKFDLTLALAENQSELSGSIEYNTDLFDGTTIERLAGHFARLLASAVESPSTPMKSLPLLSEAESRQIAEEWNGGRCESTGACLHELFEAQADRTPRATALIWGEQEISYQELEARSNRLAHRLRGLGVGPEKVAGVCLERTADMVVAVLAVLKAGGAYLPLDPSYPAQRLSWMLEESAASVVLTQEALLARLPEHGSRKIWLDRSDAEPADAARLPRAGSEQNLAYVIYTSGSTGRPKGVTITHASAALLVGWAGEVFSAEELSGVLASTSLSFDLSVFELFVPLSWGGTVILAPNVLHLPSLPAAQGVRLVNTVPSALAELVRAESLPAGVKTVNLAGEPLPRALARQVQATGTVERLWNLYGPSEDTTYSTFGRVEESDRAPSIGRPLPGTQAWVVDGGQSQAPVGVAGELLLGGASLARGYLGRPELTAERFVPDALSGEPGARLYRTGDRARWLASGELEFLGRIDHQVKVRGFRIELGEVEAALSFHAGVWESVVVVRTEGSGEPRLVAYVVPAPGETLAAAELRSFLKERLPDYMVPSHFIVLESLPLTPNGKLDRKALPAPESPRLDPETYQGPRTQTESVLSAIWADVLGLDRVGVHDNFFELGGHSLLATRVTSRLRNAFQVELALRELFEEPTVAGLARRVEKARGAGAEMLAPPLVPAARDTAPPLSFAQERLWFLDQLEPDSAAYNIPVALRVEGRLDVEVLRRGLEAIVHRHEALRTTFAASEGVAVQVISEPSALELPLVDLPGRETDARELIAREAGRPFDLSRGPLLRGLVVRLGEDEHFVLVTMHHIVSDGWSMGILVREVSALYASLSSGAPSPLPPLPVQYADYAVWQRSWLRGEVLEREIGYWREHLAGAPPRLELPTDRPRPAVQSFRGAAHDLRLPASLSRDLQALSRRQGTTPFMTLLSGFQALLGRYTGQEDIVVGTPVAGRNHLELEELVGFFVNTLVLRTDLSVEPGFGELLSRVRETVLSAHAHQEVPFEKLVEELEPERSLAHSPLFQVMFVLQNAPEAALAIEGLRLSALEAPATTAKFDLTLALAENRGELLGSIEYNTDLFDVATTERLAGHFARLLTAAVESPLAPVRSLPLLSEAESRQIAEEWNVGRRESTGACLHEVFEAQVDRTPQATALIWGEQEVSYQELEEHSNRLAHRLRRLGVGPEKVVGVCLERTADLLVAVLAVLKSGGAYLPLDPSYPAQRLSWMLEESAASVVLTQEALLARLPEQGSRKVYLGCTEPEPAGAARLPRAGSDQNLAYVIYTSGSTGSPKGVAITHASAALLVGWAGEVFSAEELSGVLASTSLSFDLSVFELFVPLSWGGTVILASNVLHLPSLPAAQRVRLVNTVPSALAELMRAESLPAGVKTVNLAGEPLPRALALQVQATGTVEHLWNLYGPSEDTTYSTFGRVEESERSPSIGRPLPGTQAWVVDGDQGLAPAGVAGELLLGGAGLGRGYLGRPELTAERFVPDAFGGEPGARLYRTGDRARWLARGELEFLGRIDHQVKVRGFRIELGEVEAALSFHAGVRESVVVVRTEGSGEPRLVAYVVPAPGEMPAVPELRSFLKERLPDYMVPSYFVALESLPLTPNGKIDRKALPAPEALASPRSIAPRDSLELAITGVWEDLLGVAPLGVTDDFFTVGGHSLLAVRLTSRIERLFDRKISLAQLLRLPTIEAMAGLLRREGQAPDPPLVVLRNSGSRSPLVVVHPAGGNVACYRELVRQLPPERPIYALQRRAGEEGLPPGASIEEIATHHLEALAAVQPAGPYLLCGWSTGGVVAFEMARQLEARGEPVELLGLIDSVVPEPGGSIGNQLALLASFGRSLGLRPEELARLASPELGAMPPDQRWSWLLTAAQELSLLSPDLEPERLRELFATFQADLKAISSYRPGRYGGRVTVFAAEAEESSRERALAAAWSDLADGIKAYRLEGDHYSLLREPHVRALAGRMQEVIQASESRLPQGRQE